MVKVVFEKDYAGSCVQKRMTGWEARDSIELKAISPNKEMKVCSWEVSRERERKYKCMR